MTRTVHRLITTLLAGTALTTPLAVAAGELPTGASIVHGSVGIAMPGANAMAIQQSSQTAIVNWQTFSIGQGARVDVAQPNASAALLSRVTGSTPSTIAGQLNANGQIYLVNPNGIVITPSGVVRAGGFVGSTLGISDEDFKAGRRAFKGNGASATVSNQGSIDIAQGGYAALLGGRVENAGVVSVPLGRVGFGAGERATLDLSGDGFLQVAVPSRADGSDAALISHSGRISAAGGRVEMQAATARDLARNAINLSGLVEARSVSGRSGAIVLGGGEGGTVTVSGRLDASARGARAVTRTATHTAKAARGGDITVTGDAIRLTGARLQADGTAGGGRIRVGGDFQGGGTLQRARVTTVDSASTLSADAGRSGRGGDVVVWSDGSTAFAGTIRARGGATLGDGGATEVSSKGLLAYTGTTDLSAAHGAFGTLLLDPYNVTISGGGTAGQTQGTDGFTPNADNSVINASDLAMALAKANVTVTTGAANSAGGQDGNIAVQTNVTWNAATTLTLSAFNSIRVGPTDNAPSAPAGSIAVPTGGGLILRADNSGRGIGTVDFRPTSIVAFDAAAPIAVYYNPASNPAGSGVNTTSYTGPTPYTASLINAAGAITGTRSVASYMLVNTANDLQNMRNNLTGSYAQGRDIDAAAASGFSPIGGLGEGQAFSGTFDGQGLRISNLTINQPTLDNVGLFGVTTNAQLSNIALFGTVLNGRNNVGGLVGSATRGSIVNVSNTRAVNATTGLGSVDGIGNVGGLVGLLDGAITNGSTSVNVTGSGSGSSIGGLVGAVRQVGADTPFVSRSFASGVVRGVSTSGLNAIGGLVGTVENGRVEQSYANGAVAGAGSVGGLVGDLVNRGTISATYATGLVSNAAAAGSAGGLVGSITAAAGLGASVDQSYSTGLVTGAGTLGGLVGTANGQATVTNAYWDAQTSGRLTSAGGTGQTTAQLQGALPGGFNPTIWSRAAGTYPYLSWRFPTGILAVSGIAQAAADPGAPIPGTTVTLLAGGAQSATQTGANGTYYIALAPLAGTAQAVTAILPAPLNGGALADAPTGAGALTLNVRAGRGVATTAAIDTTGLTTRLTNSGVIGGVPTFAAAGVPIFIELLNPAGFTVDQPITVTGRLQIAGAGSTASAGPITIGAAGFLRSGGDVVVATTLFTNNAGATGIQTGGRSLVYSQDYANDTRGGLPGGNLYARSFSANPPATITEAGNQFIFTSRPILTVTATGGTREYGSTTLTATPTITGLVNNDTAAQAYTGTPSVTDATPVTAGVGTYATGVQTRTGTLTSPIGYAINTVDAQLTITPAPLTITARDATKPFGTNLAFDGSEFNFSRADLRNGDTVTRVTLTSDGAPAEAPVAGSPYPIVASNAVGTGLVSTGPGASALGGLNYRVTYLPGLLTVTQPPTPQGPTPLEVATNAPTLTRNLPNLFQPVVPRNDTLDIANLEGGGPSLGVGEPAGAKGATLGYLKGASAELDAAMAACERQDGRRVKAYADCVGGALDTYAGKLELRLAQLPPAFRNIPAVVRQAAQKIRAARTITEARQAVRVAVVAVRKAIALIRADEPAVAQRQRREGNAIASALQSVDSRLSRSVGL
ncbi:beta strand repeat-containing protein [Methylobacterium sp. J-090]|uniref:beta strand repeat-containing protein n=1 Tax=Methylobacterium sp. J-090 TaxID=2836666 RepID=UPI001FBC0ED4|nr:filamentous hemagglutinin N-terminal domain-containing protein [Methylobacterium sp. J-090]MCJ2081730.1 filamentous hemagglutinin N-terminal domain-containing protein [Methylobacterium sp. J-090]